MPVAGRLLLPLDEMQTPLIIRTVAKIMGDMASSLNLLQDVTVVWRMGNKQYS